MLKTEDLKAKTNFHTVLNLELFSKVRKYENKYHTKICDLTVIKKKNGWQVDFIHFSMLQVIVQDEERGEKRERKMEKKTSQAHELFVKQFLCGPSAA